SRTSPSTWRTPPTRSSRWPTPSRASRSRSPDRMFWAVVAIVVIALFFDYTNGFHDAANAIATSVSTRALTPRTALLMAAVATLFGAFFGTQVAPTGGGGIIEAPQGADGLWLVGAALIGATGWNLLT